MSHFWSGGDFKLPSSDHPWLRADALIETLKSVNGTTYFLSRHLNRLKSASKDLFMEPVDLPLIQRRISDLVRADDFSFGRVRLTYFSNGEYLISHDPLKQLETDEEESSRLLVAESPRFSRAALHPFKTMAYTEASFGQRIAKSEGFADLIYMNERDQITETGYANLLVEIDGRLITPAASCGLLPGIVRGVLLEWFPQIEEGILTRASLSEATGLYLLSSIREIELVSEVRDGSTLYQYEFSEQVRATKSEYLKRSKSEPDS